MDELEISGKRYLSSRRAAKQYHYHSDYIGQLVRGGKVVGTKVGRAWYVEETSLASYLGQENETPFKPTLVYTPPSINEVVYIGKKPPVEEKKVNLEIQRTGLTYIPDNEPLLPEIHIDRRVEELDVYTPPAQIGEELEVTSKVRQTSRPRHLSLLLLGISGFTVIFLVALSSNFIVATTNVEQGMPANVTYSLQ